MKFLSSFFKTHNVWNITNKNKSKHTNKVGQRTLILIWIQFLTLMYYEMDCQSQDVFYVAHQNTGCPKEIVPFYLEK